MSGAPLNTLNATLTTINGKPIATQVEVKTTGTIAAGQFSVKLGKPIAALEPMTGGQGVMPDGITISNTNAKGYTIGSWGLTKTPSGTSTLGRGTYSVAAGPGGTTVSATTVSYLYLNEATTISGEGEIDAGIPITLTIENGAFKAGWNTVISTYSMTMEGQTPTGGSGTMTVGAPTSEHRWIEGLGGIAGEVTP